jgi:Ethanolamine utilization protein EutJ (predicted chaperonin)
MGRGPGKVMRRLLEEVHAESEEWDRGYLGVSMTTLARVIYETDEPTAAQRSAVSRAAHRLQDLGEVEVFRGDEDDWRQVYVARAPTAEHLRRRAEFDESLRRDLRELLGRGG